MAEIFLAHAENALGADRRIAVKQMLPEYSADSVFAQALISEAKLASGLSHHNIVRVLDLGRESGHLYIAMEYVEGYDLNQLLGRLSRARVALPLEFALLIARAVLCALDYAHRALDARGRPLGIVHRDVSPANVLISLEGEIRLCDFGIARAYGPGRASDAGRRDIAQVSTALAGKACYMSPEHGRGEQADARSDVFAAGVLLWELCAGRRMSKSGRGEGHGIAADVPAPELPSRGLPDVERLRAVLRRALAFDPAERFQSAEDMLDELEDYAFSSRLIASELRFGAFLSQHFGAQFAEQRKTRERVAREVQTPVPSTPAPVPASSAIMAKPVRASAARAAQEAAGDSPDPDATIPGFMVRPSQHEYEFRASEPDLTRPGFLTRSARGDAAASDDESDALLFADVAAAVASQGDLPQAPRAAASAPFSAPSDVNPWPARPTARRPAPPSAAAMHAASTSAFRPQRSVQPVTGASAPPTALLAGDLDVGTARPRRLALVAGGVLILLLGLSYWFVTH
jgi:serine/threonine-protein kinase